jgi:hypothetical protein
MHTGAHIEAAAGLRGDIPDTAICSRPAGSTAVQHMSVVSLHAICGAADQAALLFRSNLLNVSHAYSLVNT